MEAATAEAPSSAPAQTESTPAPQAETAPAPVAPAPPEKPKQEDVDFSSRFAALTRKERAILEREKQFKQYQNDPTYKEYLHFKELKANPRQNAIKLVESTGVPLKDFYEDLTGTILNDGKPSVELELKSIKEQLEADRKAAKDRESAAEKARVDGALESYKSAISGTVDKKADDYELMSHYKNAGSIDLAIEVAAEYYDKHNQVLPPDEACKLVEKWLEGESKKLLGTKKFGVKAPEVPPVETPKSEPQTGNGPKPVLNTQPKTLTNSNTVATVPTQQPGPEYLLDREKRLKWSAEKLKKAWDEHGKR